MTYPSTARRKKFISRRVRRLRKIKTSKGCENCGYNESPEALDFAHKDPENKNPDCAGSNGYGISILYNRVTAKDKEKNRYYIKQLFLEIRKCKILCKNCHAIETFKNGEQSGGHRLHAIRMNKKNIRQKEHDNLDKFFVDSLKKI